MRGAVAPTKRFRAMRGADGAPPLSGAAPVLKDLFYANIGVNPLSLFSSKKTNADSYPDISCENARRPFNPKNA